MRMSVNTTVFGGLVYGGESVSGELLDTVDAYVPELVRPIVPPDMDFSGEAERVRLQEYRLKAYAKETPFTKTQMQNIVKNMALSEALNAGKASDRLAALTLVGKASSVDYFTAEKREITLSTDKLRSQIEDKLNRMFGGDILDAEFSEVSP